MEKTATISGSNGLVKESYGVSGMTCASCAVSLESYLKNQQGVDEVSVNYPNQSVAVQFDAGVISLDTLQQAAREIGYEIIGGAVEEKEREMGIAAG